MTCDHCGSDKEVCGGLCPACRTRAALAEITRDEAQTAARGTPSLRPAPDGPILSPPPEPQDS